ncbi:uncharacterized protein F5891DRAFT_1184362 [Suillus fuscotomentosus]|uniref:Uncharacterized protein n=1 Tax=Suillus fuscotomentosus TaxID=1912939 RepID=A0AAD4EDD8_9AGAM|nr:uncharacterized protein F5891DRAFT_1184362 [Suillus fuscotomentosus]KAG1904179.1 hypothetical protein F5891DRAFT_1184362 [Suillus fuscotomentosus]
MSSLQQADIVFLASLASVEALFCLPSVGVIGAGTQESQWLGYMHGSCAFFHWFPQLLSHPDIMALIPGGSPTLGAASAAPFPSTQPLPSSSQLQPNNKKSRKQDNQRPQADVQQDLDWGFDQDTLADLETHWHDSSLDAGAEMNDGLRVLQHALQSAGAGGQPVFPSFHDILTAPAQPPNDDTSAMHAFPIHTPSKPPHITDQLDPLWAGDLNTRAREAIESTRVAGRRKEMERKAKQHFVLYWFDADNAPVLMQWVMHCPYFPQYQLSDDPALVASLGDNILKIDVFEEHFMWWIPSALTYPFTLDLWCHIFIQCHSVTDCSDFNDLFKSSKLVARPTHMRFNMKGECDSLHKTNKQQQASAAASSSDVEIIDDTQLTPKPTLGKHHRLATPPLSPTQLLSDSDNDFDTCLTRSMSPTPPLIMSSSSSPVESTPRVIPVHIPIYNPAKPRQRWLHGMYTVDMAIGFQQMAIPKLRGFYGQEQLFRLIFGDTPFVKTTYHDNHKAWLETDLTVLETHKLTGRTEDGLWENYLAAQRAALGLGSKKCSGRK